jgi:hypothetical protein
MLWTIFVILLILWLLGVVSSYTLGGFIHILLIVALVVLLINVIQGRRAVLCRTIARPGSLAQRTIGPMQ